MTREKLLEKCVWNSYNMDTSFVFSPLLETEVKVMILPEKGWEISDNMMAGLGDF